MTDSVLPVENKPFSSTELPEDTKEDLQNVEHIEASAGGPTDAIEDAGMVKMEAVNAIHREKEMSIWQSAKAFRYALGWSMIASLSIIMQSYDSSVATNFYGLAAFNQRFGQYYPKIHQYQVPAKWQSALSFAGTGGNWLGYAYGAWCVDKYGYRKALMINYILVIPLIAIRVFAQNLWMILAVNLVQGIPNTIFSVAPISYAADVCPIHLRAYLTGWVNCCNTLGGLLAQAVLVGTEGMGNKQIAYRLPWATPWIWPIPLFIAMYLAPESPWWLIRHQEIEKATQAVRRLAPAWDQTQADETVAMMVRTNQEEEQFNNTTKPATWKEMFTGVDRRRTLTGMMILTAQWLTGYAFAGSPTYFFEQAGLKQAQAYGVVFGEKAFLVLMNVVGFAMMIKCGRRTLYLWGHFVTLMCLVLIGCVSFAKSSSSKWVTVATIFIWNGSFDALLGPAMHCMVTEAPSTRLRSKTVAIALWSQSIVSTVGGVLNPYMINPTAWNWKGKTAFFWVPFAAISWIWGYFYLPEFKDRSYWEIDILYERKTPARKFKTTKVEAEIQGDHDGAAATTTIL